ncbi:MAG: polyprenyl diphosphate synthase [Microgenomates group bacterium]|nr:polyprenyl diphosphate synthase [Microgenomates group bacterium]
MKTYLPVHVAIIPDGNRRWAKKNNLPVFIGHQKGYERVVEIIRKAREMKIKILTIWGFSTENWLRNKQEVDYLMKIFETMIENNLKEAIKEKCRIIHLGRKDRFNERLRKKIIDAEETTKNFNKYYLCIALDYGGKDEIVRAIKKIKDSKFNISDLNETNFNQFLDSRELPQPEPDLIIRTSGELRTSGFMLWQSAYSEFVFIDKLFPDFTVADFEKSIRDYSLRERRFGK